MHLKTLEHPRIPFVSENPSPGAPPPIFKNPDEKHVLFFLALSTINSRINFPGAMIVFEAIILFITVKFMNKSYVPKHDILTAAQQ